MKSPHVALTAPAFALEETTTIETQTITRQVVPESGSTVSTTIIAPNPPPAPRVEAPPPPPRPSVVWTPRHWQWVPGQQTYSWVAGVYIDPPRPHAAWVPGHWIQEPRGWVWIGGRWD